MKTTAQRNDNPGRGNQNRQAHRIPGHPENFDRYRNQDEPDSDCPSCLGWGWFKECDGERGPETGEWERVRFVDCPICDGNGKRDAMKANK